MTSITKRDLHLLILHTVIVHIRSNNTLIYIFFIKKKKKNMKKFTHWQVSKSIESKFVSKSHEDSYEREKRTFTIRSTRNFRRIMKV